MRFSRILAGLGAALIGLWAVSATWTQVGCEDHWWHILTGQVIAASGHIPTIDLFSFTFPGHPWTNWEWLGSLWLYGVHRLGGADGLIVLRMGGLLVLGLILAAHGRLLARAENAPSPVGRTLLLFLVLTIVYPRVADRPHTLAFPLAALAAYGADLARLRGKRWPLAALFPLTILWRNLHPSWILSPLILGCSGLSALQKARHHLSPSETARLFRHWLLAGLALLSAFLLSPYLGDSGTMIGTLFTHKVSAEWVSLAGAFSPRYTPGLVAFLLLVALTGGGLLAQWRRNRSGLLIGDGLLVLSTIALAVLHARFTAQAAILAYPVLCRLYAPAKRRPDEETGMSGRRAALGAGAMLLAAILAFAASEQVKQVMGTRAGWGVNRHDNPVAAVDYIERHDLRLNPITSSTDLAAYLLFRRWPKQRSFIDGRVPTLFPVEFIRRYNEMSGPAEFDALTAQYEVGLVLIGHGLFAAGNRSLLNYLTRSPKWSLVFFDSESAIFTDCTQAPRSFCERETFRLLDPSDHTLHFLTAPGDPDRRERLWGELERAVANHPADALAARYLYQAVAQLPAEQQAAALQRAEQLAARYPQAASLRRALEALRADSVR